MDSNLNSLNELKNRCYFMPRLVKAYGNIGSGTTNSVYSTEETEIGTWIDGEKIYRKVIHCNTPSTVNNDFIVSDVSDLKIKTLVSLSSIIHCTNIDYQISNLFMSDTQYVSLTYSHLNKKIRQFIKYPRMINRPQDITIEYTKTEETSSVIRHTLPSGRTIYRHSSDQGSVIECTMHGKQLALFVADAQYRTTKSFSKPTSGACVNSRTGTIFCPNGYSTLSADMQTLDDTWMDENIYYFDSAPCTYANIQTEAVINSAAAQYTRSLTFLDNNGLDIPNMWEVFMIMSEGDYIDELDPTVITTSSTMSLGYNMTTKKRFCDGARIASCDAAYTSVNYSYAGFSDYPNATESYITRTTGNAIVIPVRELNLF